MKKIAGFLIAVGVVFLSIGSYQYIRSYLGEKQAFNEAEELLAQSRVEREARDESADEKKDDSAEEELIEEPVIFSPEKGETVGLLHIDKIDASIAIIEGTDPDELDRGVGHLVQTAYPGENDQILLSGHRDTVFTRLGEIEIGDIFSVELPYGTFDYQMVDSTIVSADDTTVIGSTAPDEELVITTCYPFGYIGHAPDRYVIYAVPVEE